jgi:hypothetical protein
MSIEKSVTVAYDAAINITLARGEYRKAFRALLDSALAATDAELEDWVPDDAPESDSLTNRLQAVGCILLSHYGTVHSALKEAGCEKDATRLYQADRKFLLRISGGYFPILLDGEMVEICIYFRLRKQGESYRISVQADPFEDRQKSTGAGAGKSTGAGAGTDKAPTTVGEFATQARKSLSADERSLLAARLIEGLPASQREAIIRESVEAMGFGLRKLPAKAKARKTGK